MARLHRYADERGYYIRSAFGDAIITYQLTAEGIDLLLRQGLSDGDHVDADELDHLIREGRAFTRGTGVEITAGTDKSNAAPELNDKLIPPATITTKGKRAMSYQANRWLMGDLHRRIVAASKQLPEYLLLLRPTRRHIFIRNFRLPEGKYVPEFFNPCFGILARRDDIDKKPCLVIETEEPGEGMRELYEDYGVLWTLISQEANQFTLTCNHGGTSLRVEETYGSLHKLLCAPLAWHERRISFPQGSYVHSHTERTLRDAVTALSPSFRIEVHHQVPLKYVLGYKDGLTPDEQRLLGQEIDAVIIQSFEADPDGAVILPIRIDVHDSHRATQIAIDKDTAIRKLCERFCVPLLTIAPTESQGSYLFQCDILGLPVGQAVGLDAQQWAGALAPFLGAAIRHAGRGF